MIRKSTKLIQAGNYAAQVEVEFDYGPEDWSPTISLADARKLDAVRMALERGDVVEAAKYGRVFELKPLELPAE